MRSNPDPKTLAALKQNFASEPRVEAINAGLYRCKATLHFRHDASRAAIFAAQFARAARRQ
jgi:hypothetical protein